MYDLPSTEVDDTLPEIKLRIAALTAVSNSDAVGSSVLIQKVSALKGDMPIG